MDKQFLNVIILGLGFMLLFTAWNTGSMIQQTVVKSIHEIEDSDYNASGYTSLCILYAAFGLANWITPSIIVLIGPKLSIILGAFSYCLFLSNFLYPNVWILYFLSAIIGIGAAVIWTGQGNYLTLNSDKETMARNSGTFWALFQCSLLWGNIFVFFMFKSDKIDRSTRLWTYGVLTAAGLIGVAFLFLLRGGKRDANTAEGEVRQELTLKESLKECLDALIGAFKLLITPRMAILSILFFYSGIEQSFFSGVYGTAIGNSKKLEAEGNPKRFIGIAGILIGVGEIIGSGIFGLLGSKTNKYGRDLIVCLGFVVHIITYYLVFLNLPKLSAHEGTTDPSYITSNLGIAMFCSFTLGFGDACFNTQMYSITGVIFSEKSAPAFALLKFTQSIASAIAYFYSDSADLHIQLLILVIFATLGTISFFTVEWSSHNDKVSDRSSPSKITSVD